MYPLNFAALETELNATVQDRTVHMCFTNVLCGVAANMTVPVPVDAFLRAFGRLSERPLMDSVDPNCTYAIGLYDLTDDKPSLLDWRVAEYAVDRALYASIQNDVFASPVSPRNEIDGSSSC